ncbi:MAG: hypothetical protein AB7H71_07145 [Alphaproteobacteria bacterium]
MTPTKGLMVPIACLSVGLCACVAAPPPQSPTMTVAIALLVNAGNPAYSGKAVGCDKVVLVTRPVAQTTDPLTAAMQVLFARQDPWRPWDNVPGNFLSTQTNLDFDRAVLYGGVAQIMLTGGLGPLGGACDDPRTRAEIEQTALQVPGVSAVEIFLDGKTTTLLRPAAGP